MNPLGGPPTRFEDRSESLRAAAGYFKAGEANLGVGRSARLGRHRGAGDDRAAARGGRWLPDQDWSLRVTQIYRRDGSDWQLVHRHADPLVRTVDLEEAAALARR
jgi:hypothetical protein